MTRAILYRHWLEVRGKLIAGGIVGILLSILDVAAVSFGTQPGSEGFPLVAHIWLSGVAALFAGLFLGGTGIRTDTIEPGHPSLYYTLTLPVSRFALIWTRSAIALAATLALFAAMLVAVLIALLTTGLGVPPGEMAKASLLIGLLAVPLQAVVGLLAPMWDDRLRPLALALALSVVAFSVIAYLNYDPGDLPWLVLGLPWLAPAMAFIGSPPDPWHALGAAVLIVALSLSISTLIARRRDF